MPSRSVGFDPRSDPQGVTAARADGVGPERITERHRAVLSELADLLIPRGDEMPSASEAGVAGKELDVLLASRPDLVDELTGALESAEAFTPIDALDRLRLEPEGGPYTVLTTVVGGAYFLNPEIRARLGYPGQQAIAIREPSLDAEDEALIRAVMDRGPIYRE